MNIDKWQDNLNHIICEFEFPNINLLDSSHHNECNGAVTFSVDMNNSLADGTTIFNHAGIYFDYNPVVMTNTAVNTVGCLTKVAIVPNTKEVEIYPNPATDEFIIIANKDAYSSYTITSSIGQVLLQQLINASQTKVNVKALPVGLYYITLRGDNGSKVMKFVKM